MRAVTEPHPPRSALDPAALRSLLADLEGDEEAVRRFVGTYMAMAEDRLLRLESAVARGDQHEVEVAALSLRTTSDMIGAILVSDAVARLEDSIRCPAETRERLARLRPCMSETARALTAAVGIEPDRR